MKPYSHEEHIRYSFDAFCKKVLRNEARSCDCRGTGCFSVYARKMLIDGYVIRLDYSDVKAMSDDKLLVSLFGCAVETADLEFEKTRLFAMQKGNNLAHHLIQDFEPGEVGYAQAHEIRRQLADEVLGGKQYAEYGSLKKRMREYDAVKQNIDSILSPTVGRNRTKHCNFSDIHTLLSSNIMCVRRFTVDNHTLFLYKIMCDCQSEVRSMNAKEKIEELLKASEDGTITAAQVTEAGLHRSVLQEFVKSGEMYRFGRGLYVRSSAWEDDFYLLQRKYGRGIYSHDTALYLLGYSDRTPAKYTMTFPKGYNAPSLKLENLIVKRVVPENYEFGRIEIESPSGNPIRVYDLERTLCDILRGSGSDVQIVGEAMKRYAASKDKNIHKLMQYADQLRVKPKVLRYMEVLL